MYSERDRTRLFLSFCFVSVLISPPRVYFPPSTLLNIPSPHVLHGYLGVHAFSRGRPFSAHVRV